MVFTPIFFVVSKGNFPVDISNSSIAPEIDNVSIPVRVFLILPSVNILVSKSKYCFIILNIKILLLVNFGLFFLCYFH